MREIQLLAVLVLVLIPAQAISQACDAYFTFDGNLSDASGNGYHGSMIGPNDSAARAQFSSGIKGQALFLDGKSAMRTYLDLNPDLCPQVTLSGWVRVENFADKKTQYIVATGAGAGPGLRFTRKIGVLKGTGNGLSQREALRDGRAWFFFAGVYDQKANTYRFHWRDRVVEGKLAEERRSPEDALWVGAFNDSLNYAIKNAYVDELRITGKSLSADEIARLREGRPGAVVMRSPSQSKTGGKTASTSDSKFPQPTGTSGQFSTTKKGIDAEDLPDRPIDLLGKSGKSSSGTPLIDLSPEAEAARTGTQDPNLTPKGNNRAEELAEMTQPREMPITQSSDRGGRTPDEMLAGLKQLDYRIAQVNSRVSQSHYMYGMEIPLTIRMQVYNADADDNVSFYLALGEPGSTEHLMISDHYQGSGAGPHVVEFTVPLKPPYVTNDRLKVDLFLLREKQMPGLPGQTVAIKVPVEDVDPSNDRRSLDYAVHRPKGYVLTHEHPTYGMAFGGNYAFAGASGNYRHGIMQKGYTEKCGGCGTLGNCDHGEVKGSFTGAIGALGRDMGDHLPQMGPYHNSNSHLRYSTEWIKEAWKPSGSGPDTARMKIMVAFAVENEAMCEQLYYVNKGHGGVGGNGYACSRGDSYDSLKRQLDNLKAWAAENDDWMEIAYNATDARRIVNEDKLAIILGVEAEYAFGAENRKFDPVDRLNTYYNQGVRTFYLAHKINSRLAGADIYFPKSSKSGKAIRTIQALSGCFYYDDNIAHFPLEGRLGKKLCDNNCGANAFKGGKIADNCSYKLSDISELNMTDYVMTRGGGQFNGFKLYPYTPGFGGQGGSRIVNDIERNNISLSHDGERVVREAMLKGMIVNIDHVSSAAREEIYDLATEAFDNYPLNALHNKPNQRLTNKKHFWRHEYDIFHNELDQIKETGGFFGFRMGPTDSLDYAKSGITANCPRTSTETAKMLAWLIDEGHNVGYALDYATTTQGVHSRTMHNCGLNLGTDRLHKYGNHLAQGLSHVGMMKKWHKELDTIGLKEKYLSTLKYDGVEAFIQMWEKSEAASSTGEQITRIVFGGANPTVH